jgi:L,D-peptidoglycan transpeptidase YkuD (ErfK/YbiS/YcfS/YnhG family)
VSPFDLVVSPRGARFMGRMMPVCIGRGGITQAKAEGDGATPSGVHSVVDCLYRPDRLAAPNNWAHPILPGDLWSDDSADPYYNHLVKAPHGFGHEEMRRADPLYDIVLTTDWNWPHAIPGDGSAIFIHRWRKPGHPTEGCLAFHGQDLHWLAARMVSGTRIVIQSA